MRSFIITLVIGVVLLVLAGVSQSRAAELLAGIKGIDDRLVMSPGEYPWSAVGRINAGTGGYCTGVLTGPRVVITAAHCLYDKDKKRFVPPSQVRFVVGHSGGEFLTQSTVASYFIPHTYEEGVPPTGKIAASDWTFVILNNDLGTQNGWFGVAALDRAALKHHLEIQTAFVQAGYSKDKKPALTTHINCLIEGFATGLKLTVHRCDAVPGDSGSPIFFFEDGLPVLAAIHVATTLQQQPVRGVAVPSATFIGGVRELKLGAPRAPLSDGMLPLDSVRTLLAYLGYTGGGELERAIRRFQKTEGIEITGRISYNLIGHLVMALARER